MTETSTYVFVTTATQASNVKKTLTNARRIPVATENVLMSIIHLFALATVVLLD